MRQTFNFSFKSSFLVSAFTVLGCVPSKSSDTSSLDTSPIKTVAIIGDSQTAGEYGAQLASRVLNDSKQRMTYFGGASSARIHHWIDGGFAAIPADFFRTCESPSGDVSCTPSLKPGTKTRSINSIISSFPEIDAFIITLGDNHLYDPVSAEPFTNELTDLLLSKGKKCAFVTPTLGLGKFKDKETLMKSIERGLEKARSKYGRTCVFVDSYHMGKDVIKNQSDKATLEASLERDYMKLHPSGEGAKLWANRVFEALVEKDFLHALK